MATAVQVSNEYRNLPVTQLQESTTNPRRRFDEHSLAELAASFKAQGVLQPLLVRTIEDDKYEVIAGARRLRAAKLAALEEVPTRIAELSDIEVLECQLVENGQREGVHPLEEACAYKRMIEADGAHYDVARIAAKIGRSPVYVATRLRLTELIPSLAEAFLADQIGVGHALEIAKLPQPEQQRAFEAAFHSAWNGSKETRILRPVRDLIAWIEQNILLALDSVSFDKNDVTLIPEAGSCANCPKRTGYNTLLFDVALRDSCLDGLCFRAKIERHVAKTIEKKPELVQISTTAWSSRNGAPLGRSRYVELELKKPKPQSGNIKLSPLQKPCEKMTDAIVTDGGNRGHIVKVCADPSCRVHHAKQPSALETARTRAEERKRMEKEKLAITVRHRVLAEVLKRVGPPLKRGDLLTIAQYAIQCLPFNQEARMAKRHKLNTENGVVSGKPGLLKQAATQDEAELSKLLLEISLLDSAYQLPAKEADDSLLTVAKRYRLDVEKIQKAVAQEFAAKKAKQTAKQKKSGKKVAPTPA